MTANTAGAPTPRNTGLRPRLGAATLLGARLSKPITVKPAVVTASWVRSKRNASPARAALTVLAPLLTKAVQASPGPVASPARQTSKA